MKVAERALHALRAALGVDGPGELERDATLLRMAFAAEATWKAAQVRLREVEGVDAASPKGVVRACVSVGMLPPSWGESALQLLDDRNLVVHTYNEALAREILERVPGHERTLTDWIEALVS